jgi:flagellar basal-body rod protein FlgC
MDTNGIFGAMRHSFKGLNVSVRKLDAVSENIANAEKVAKPGEAVYQMQKVIPTDASVSRGGNTFEQKLNLLTGTRGHMSMLGKSELGTKGTVDYPESSFDLLEENRELMDYDPSHPYADDQGFVRRPDINLVEQMVEMMKLNRFYEANITSMDTAKNMAKKALDI